MSEKLTYVVSVSMALLVHLAVVGLLMANWSADAETEITTVKPYYIEAAMVAENPFTARQRKEQETRLARAQQQETARQRQAEQQAARAQADKSARQEKEKALQDAAARNERELARLRAAEQLARVESAKADQARQAEAEERDRVALEQSLAMAVSQEQAARRAITDDEKAMAYVAQIQRDIISNWSRPPSARNGMEALLRVFLVPTGEVVNVVVERSSDNDAFDRSAMQAVTKAGRFQVPPESRQFERSFREFTVLFRPEDLRL
ncbi:MAG: cell envelope integrity protein TolA [Proteobacteria bacterium]|nr:cell envelope integrity protein TolA [Pseudomonadota bacterium]MDA1299871.1 cell envelope integrity protein TolA [Pseudomonadota bacterium]